MKKLFSLLTLALLTLSVGAANTYVKVTSADQLVAGKKYIIVNEDAVTVMGAVGTYGAAIVSEKTINSGILDIEGLDDAVELTLGGGQGAWTFAIDETTYIAYTSTKNTLNTGNDATATSAQWTVTAKNGGYILTNVAATDRVLQYNANSGQERFACYKGTQQDAFLFVQDANATPIVEVAAPTLTPAQTFNESIEVTITNNEEGATLYYSTDGLAWQVYEQALTLTETTTVYAKATKDGVDSPVVSAKYTKAEPIPEGAIAFNPSDFDAVESAAWSITKDGVTISCTSGTITNDQFRMFKNQTTTFKSTAGAIEKIVFTCTASGTDKYGPGCFAAQDGYSYEGNVGTWEGSGNNIEFVSASNQVRATQILVFLGEAPAVETPVFDPVHNTKFVGSLEVTITCATEGADIYYMINDGDEVLYTGPFTLTETATVKAYADLDGTESASATAKYIKLAEVSNIAEGNALGNKVDFIFNGNAVVTYQNGSNLWIRDESGSGLIYGNQVPAMEQGTVINSGWIAQKYNFRGGLVPEFQYPTGVEASETVVAVEPFERTTLALENVNEYVIMKDLTVIAETDTTVSNYQKYFYNAADSLVLFNQFGIEFTLEEGKTYDVVGTVTVYNEKPQLYIISVTEHKEDVAGLRGDVNNSNDVTIADVSALIDYLLTNDATGINLQNANCNLDESVSIADVSALIDYLLTNQW